jgi:hypothetical protein
MFRESPQIIGTGRSALDKTGQLGFASSAVNLGGADRHDDVATTDSDRLDPGVDDASVRAEPPA